MTVNRFGFATAGRVVFGPGAARDLPELVAGLGRRACLVTGSDPGRRADLEAGLARAGFSPLVMPVRGEPTLEAVTRAVARAKAANVDFVVSCGGGSVMDTGKALAAMLTNPGHVTDYLEVVGAGRPLAARPVRHAALPTTAGTGAEVTANAVLTAEAHGVKVSMRSPWLFPDLALVDPELCLGAPPAVTAATGMDALTQLLEALVSVRANALTDVLCREGLALCARSLGRAFAHGQDLAARADMSLAALLSGMALANAGLGAAHGLAAPLGGRLGAPHGALCAALLPPVMAVTIRRLENEADGGQALERYAQAARILTGDPGAGPRRGADWVAGLGRELGIPPLAAWGLGPGDKEDMADKAARAGSMRGHPVVLDRSELLEILDLAM